MSDDLATGLREIAESAEQVPPFSGADVRHLAQRRRRLRRTVAALGGTAAVAAVALALVLNLGGSGTGRQDVLGHAPDGHTHAASGSRRRGGSLVAASRGRRP
ncbi:hypothetical protein ACQ4WX_49735 [Streptomyces lasalocidi]